MVEFPEVEFHVGNGISLSTVRQKYQQELAEDSERLARLVSLMDKPYEVAKIVIMVLEEKLKTKLAEEIASTLPFEGRKLIEEMASYMLLLEKEGKFPPHFRDLYKVTVRVELRT